MRLILFVALICAVFAGPAYSNVTQATLPYDSDVAQLLELVNSDRDMASRLTKIDLRIDRRGKARAIRLKANAPTKQTRVLERKIKGMTFAWRVPRCKSKKLSFVFKS